MIGDVNRAPHQTKYQEQAFHCCSEGAKSLRSQVFKPEIVNWFHGCVPPPTRSKLSWNWFAFSNFN